jgi:toxin ParE1/3/4
MAADNRRILWSRDANADLLSIWQFGAEEWSPETADRHLREIEYICDRLCTEPKLGRKRDDLIAGMRSMLVHPHVVFYEISPTAISIVRVLHQRFDVETLFQQSPIG